MTRPDVLTSAAAGPEKAARGKVAVFAGSGALPPIVAAAIAAAGGEPLVLALDGNAQADDFRPYETHSVRFGEAGRIFRLIERSQCREGVFIGGVSRPDLARIRPDLTAIRLLPRIYRTIANGDDATLTGVSRILSERGLRLVSVLDVAPHLALEAGTASGRVTGASLETIALAVRAARMLGALDVGQAAVAVGRRVVALEDAGGTDALLGRIAELRASGRIPPKGGVLVKCVKPGQDRRFDLPTIGPRTAELAQAASLDGVAAEAAGTLLAGREGTLEAFRRERLFLHGLEPELDPPERGPDVGG